MLGCRESPKGVETLCGRQHLPQRVLRRYENPQRG